eukprot:TRINITY_DN2808_c0_g2_i2.p1 TRINITY_DN2808_c0_g2~~TRINITY_DN2808_c0_g2_i2.p1  ORF type:complete len:180 (+),score=29.82 TRINITY_DN2808_c0_g2_i2:141-680(+)
MSDVGMKKEICSSGKIQLPSDLIFSILNSIQDNLLLLRCREVNKEWKNLVERVFLFSLDARCFCTVDLFDVKGCPPTLFNCLHFSLPYRQEFPFGASDGVFHLHKNRSLLSQVRRLTLKVGKKIYQDEDLTPFDDIVGEVVRNMTKVKRLKIWMPYQLQNFPVLCVDTCLLYTSPSPRD